MVDSRSHVFSVYFALEVFNKLRFIKNKHSFQSMFMSSFERCSLPFSYELSVMPLFDLVMFPIEVKDKWFGRENGSLQVYKMALVRASSSYSNSLV